MLELGSNRKEATMAEVQMVESADVLEVVLPYLYPNYVPPYKIQLPLTLKVITCCHKLEVGPYTAGDLATTVQRKLKMIFGGPV